jgi:hypothetical protein
MTNPTNNRTRAQEAQKSQDELTLVLATRGAVPRGQAFQAARRLGLAEFEWKNPETGRMGRFHTRMAGEPDPNVQRGPRLPQGMKLEDLYRDPAREQLMRDSEARQRAIEEEYQQNLRDIRSEFETADKRDFQQYTSDMAPFERNQELRGEAARGLEGLRAYENREAIEGAMQEAEEPERVRRHEEIQQLRALQDQLQQEVYRNEQAALQREIDENEQKVLQEWAAGKRKEQALQPVYPEAAIPGMPGALRGIMGLLNRLRSSPQPRREEPDIQTFPTPRPQRSEPEMNFRAGGAVKRFQGGGNVGDPLSSSSTLSPWAAPYVTGIMGKAASIASQPYEEFKGPLTAGPSALQNQAFTQAGGFTLPSSEQTTFDPTSYSGQFTAGETGLQSKAFSGLAGLTLPTGDQTSFTPTSFTASNAEQYMNPFLMSALNPQLDEARRQAEISRVEQAGRLTRAGAYGGGRQAIMESELDRNLLRNLGDITGRGYATAYESAADQFNKEQDMAMRAARQSQLYGLEGLEAMRTGGKEQRDILQSGLDKQLEQFNKEQELGLRSARQAQLYGLEGLDQLRQLGDVQRGIEQAGITADIGQFREERDYQQNMLKFMRDLLGPIGLPISTSVNQYQEPSTLSNVMDIIKGGGAIADIIKQFSAPTPAK